MNARAASSIILSLLALLPSPCILQNHPINPDHSHGARKPHPYVVNENVGPIYVIPAYATSVGYAIEEKFSDFVEPPGQNGNLSPGWNKVNKGRPSEDGRYPDTSNKESTSPENKDGPYRPDNRHPDRNQNPQNREQCREDEFRCGSNECLPSNVQCDNKDDCRDASDEAFCVTNTNEKDSCVLPPQLKNGRYQLGECDNMQCNKHPGDRVPKNSILTYVCNNNFVLLGNKISVCTSNGWCCNNIPQPCVKTCPALSSTTVDFSCDYRGQTVPCSERILPGTRASLSCKSFYKLSINEDPGFRKINCLENGTWDHYVFHCLPVCGLSIPHGKILVINGIEAKKGEFPWHVGIYRKKSDMTYENICGGSLIYSNLVVTAAHCFYNDAANKINDKSNYAVAAGKYYRAWDADEQYNQKSMIENILLSSRYQGVRGNFAEDIALVKLKTPFELTALVQPICIDWNNVSEWKQLQSGQSGKVVGWGKNIKGEPAQTLYEVDMPFVPYNRCLNEIPTDFRGFVTPDKFCAGYLNGSKGLCGGDSGGGLSFKDQENQLWFLRGIVSVSPGKKDSCDHASYVAFTSISRFLEFIRETYTYARINM